MIASGLNGLLCGNYNDGILLGIDVCQFLPMNVSTWDVAGNVMEGWCKSWIDKDYNPPLMPEGWFEQGHQPGVHVWAPPLAAALINLKDLSRSWHKRPLEVTLVVIISWLFWDEEWRS